MDLTRDIPFPVPEPYVKHIQCEETYILFYALCMHYANAKIMCNVGCQHVFIHNAKRLLF